MSDDYTLHHGDCLEVLRAMPDASVDAVVTDPPYGLSNTNPRRVAETLGRWAAGDTEYVPAGRGFMGAAWDGFVTPPSGTVLDPFAGSGTTLQAARNKGMHPIGVEQSADYCALIHERMG